MRLLDYSFLKDITASHRLNKMFFRTILANEHLHGWKIQYDSVLDIFKERQYVEEVYATNRVESIPVMKDSIAPLISGEVEPTTVEDHKALGSYEAMILCESLKDNKTICADDIRSIHRALMIRHDPNHGQYRTEDIAHVGPGTATLVQSPTLSKEAPYMLDQFCDMYNRAMADPDISKTAVAICASADFLIISPFQNGNGRMYRHLLDLFLMRAGFELHKYSSLSQKILENNTAFYSAINTAIQSEDTDTRYRPLMQFYLEQLYAMGQELECCFPHPKHAKLPKSDRLMHVLTRFDGAFSFKDIQYRAPDISQIYIRQFLSDLISEGKVEKSGNVKSTTYTIVDPELKTRMSDYY